MEQCSDVDPLDTGDGGACDASGYDGDDEAPVASRNRVRESGSQTLAPVEGCLHVPRSLKLGLDISVDPEVEKNPKENIAHLACQNTDNLKEGDTQTETEVLHAFVNVIQEPGLPEGQGSMAGYPRPSVEEVVKEVYVCMFEQDWDSGGGCGVGAGRHAST